MSELLTSTTVDIYYSQIARTALRVAERFAETTQPTSGASLRDLQELVESVDLGESGIGTAAAIREVDELFLEHAVWFHHPLYAAHLNCPVAIPAVAAETILAAVNTSVDTYDQSTVGTLMERRLIETVAGWVGFAAGDGIFTSGGTQSNLHALFLARESALASVGGSRTATIARLVIFAVASSHFSVGKSSLLLGLAGDAVIEVADDGGGRMLPGALDSAVTAAVEEGRIPMAVVATAGTTDRGVIDELAAIATVCDARGLWLHVDAAYGGGLLLSARRRHLLEGIERARSVTVDFHKSFFQPVSSSSLLVRDPRDLAAGSWHSDYLNPLGSHEPNQVDKSLQTTRRFDALKLWVTLRSMGTAQIGELFDAVIDLASAVGDLVEADPGLELVSRTQLSTVLFRVHPDGVQSSVQDELIAGVRDVLFESGRAIVAKTVIDGRPCLKLTLLNPGTTLEDVRAILEMAKDAAAALARTAPDLVAVEASA